MRRLALLAVVASAVLLPGPAHAAEPPVGRTCAFKAAGWRPVTGPTSVGVVDGGPVIVAGETVTLRCSIHADNSWHGGAAVASVTSAPGDGVAVVAPQAVTFWDEWGSSVCTQVTAGATTWYWADDGWTTDVNSWCGEGVGDPVSAEVVELVGDVVCWLNVECSDAGMDRRICAVWQPLAPAAPGVVEIREDGDIYVGGEFFWDCPPYYYG